MGLVGGECLPRRAILMGAGASTLLAMSGCGSLSPEKIQIRHQIEKSLKGFDAVKSVNVELDSDFTSGDSWSVLIILNNDPGRGETLAVLKDADHRVAEFVGGDYSSVSVSWVQNGSSVSWVTSGNEPNEVELDYLRELAKPGLGSMRAGGDHISVDRGEVKEFPTDLTVVPRSGVGVGDSFDLGGMTIRAGSDTVDLSSIPLRDVADAVDSKYREGAIIELTDYSVVHKNIQLDVAALIYSSMLLLLERNLTASMLPQQRRCSTSSKETSCFKGFILQPRGTRVLAVGKVCTSRWKRADSMRDTHLKRRRKSLRQHGSLSLSRDGIINLMVSCGRRVYREFSM